MHQSSKLTILIDSIEKRVNAQDMLEETAFRLEGTTIYFECPVLLFLHPTQINQYNICVHIQTNAQLIQQGLPINLVTSYIDLSVKREPIQLKFIQSI